MSDKPKFKEITTPTFNHPLAKCKPRGDRVVVRRDIAPKTTGGGVLLPDSFEGNKRQTGVIWSVGPGARDSSGKLIPIDLNPGDHVIITGWAGLEVSDGLGKQDDEFVILRDEDIIAVLPRPEELPNG